MNTASLLAKTTSLLATCAISVWLFLAIVTSCTPQQAAIVAPIVQGVTTTTCDVLATQHEPAWVELLCKDATSKSFAAKVPRGSVVAASCPAPAPDGKPTP